MDKKIKIRKSLYNAFKQHAERLLKDGVWSIDSKLNAIKRRYMSGEFDKSRAVNNMIEHMTWPPNTPEILEQLGLKEFAKN